MPAIATFAVAALDCPDPLALARFYSDLTGWDVAADSDASWAQLDSPAGASLAFQGVDDHRPPEWPGSEHPQQLHLDFDVPDLDAGEQAVLAIGATKAELPAGQVLPSLPRPRRPPVLPLQAVEDSELVVELDVTADADLVGGDGALEEVGQLLDVL